MKREKSQLITHKYIKTLTEYYKQLHANTVNNPEETDNFLQTYSPPKLNQEEDNLKRPVTRSEIESVTKQTKTNKTPYKQNVKTRQLHRRILPNTHKRTYTDSSWRGGNTPKDILQSHHHPHVRIRRYHQKIKLQANISEEYRCKNPQQNISKSNPTTFRKDHTPWPSGIHPKFTRMVQHMQNQCNTH